jgi:polyisoprenoid-binding protein YceI
VRHRKRMLAAGVLIAAAAALWQATGGGTPLPRTSAAPAAPAAAAQAPPGTVAYVIDPQASAVSYHVAELLFAGNRFNMAMGVTHGIQGSIFVDRSHPDASRIGPITVNVQQLTSNSSHRDDAIRQDWLESNTYPTATFTTTSIEGLPKTYTAGQTVHVRIAGNLTAHNVTKPVVFAGAVTLEGTMLTGDVQATVAMTDFGFDAPHNAALKTENKAVLELQLTARAAAE